MSNWVKTMCFLHPFNFSEQSFASMKQKYEIEIHEWKEKLNEAQNKIAQLKIEIDNLEKDKRTLNAKYDKFEEDSEVVLIGDQRLVPFRKLKCLLQYFLLLQTSVLIL